MTTMAPTRPTELQSRRVRLATGPAAVPEARRQVRAAVRGWDIPVDPDTAILLTSELVTNAVRHETGRTVLLVITWFPGQLRVDVHDTSRSWPAVADVPADAETGRGLLLVATLSTEWGYYRTPAGKAVFFALASESRPGPQGPHDRRTQPAEGTHVGTGSRDPSRGSPVPTPRSSGSRDAVTSTR